MGQQEKAGYYRALKDAGVPFDKHYREYTTDELKKAWNALQAGQPGADATRPPPGVQQAATPPPRQPQPPPRQAPVRERDPNEMPGQRINTHQSDDGLEPLRTDPETGFIWYQEEVRKPAFAKPRGRRVMRYTDTGTKQQTIQNGEYVETFEVAGDAPARSSEIKVTLPSYQVGIYKDPRYPFKVHIYNEARGFDLFEVQNFYGGAELVPEECKRTYVENVLCYDMRTVIRAIQREYRQLQLQEGKR